MDYLVKPIDIDALIEAVEKAWLDRQKDSAYERTQKNSLMLDFFEASNSESPQIILKKNGRDLLIPLREILYCESDLKYTVFHTTGGEQIRMRKNLSDYEEFLTAKGFIRINRSVLLNHAIIDKGSHDTHLNGKVVVSGTIILTVTLPYQKNLLHYW